MLMNLVISTIGKKSLHNYWYKKGNYKSVVLPYEKVKGFKSHQKGGKFELIKRYLKRYKKLEFENYLFLDDDILIYPEQIEKIFATQAKYNLGIYHPSIEGFVKDVMRPQKDNVFREVNWIELQAIGINKNILPTVLDSFDMNKSGYGLPQIWEQLINIKFQTKIHFTILDNVTVIHTRDFGAGDNTIYNLTGGIQGADKESVGNFDKFIEYGKERKVPLLSVVTIYNKAHEHYLKEMINSIPKWCELILVETIIKEKASDLYDIQKDHNITLAKLDFKENYEFDIDFSALRNKAKELATGKWILSLDADERLLVHQHEAFKHACEKYEKDNDVYAFSNTSISWVKDLTRQYKEKIPMATNGIQIRLFKNDKNIKWFSKIHETVERSVSQLGKKIIPTGIIIHHEGYMESEKDMEKKLLRNIKGLISQDITLKDKHYFNLLLRDVNNLNKIRENNG